MGKIKKTVLGGMALLFAICLGFALAACDSSAVETGEYGYGEEGTYYCAVSDGADYMLTLTRGSLMLTTDEGESVSGGYDYDGEVFSYSFAGGTTEEGSITEETVTLSYNGRSYTFLRYEFFTVTFTDGSTTISTQSVLNGKAAQDPGDASKDGYVFLGWYADSPFTTKYEFNTGITGDTTVYARFVEIEGTTEYRITYDLGNGETYAVETLNGRIYDLPEPERDGYTFQGWWVSDLEDASKLTYKYEGEELCEDTTLFAVWTTGETAINASVKDGAVVWENYDSSQMTITVVAPDGTSVTAEPSSTAMSYSFDFSVAGEYEITVSSGALARETLTFVSGRLFRVSGYEVMTGNVLIYSPVEGAERYYISVECGSENHDHAYIDNGTSLYYDFSNCDMPEDGITFTVYAVAEGRVTSESSYSFFAGLGSAEVRVENDTVLWDAVPGAQEYEIYVNGTLTAETSGTSWSLAGYGAGTYEIAVRPVTKGHWSEKSETFVFVKTSLATPGITGIDNYVLFWTAVEGATGYIVRIGDVETTIEGDITSLYFTADTYEEGLDTYEISVKAMAADSADDSPFCDPVTVTGDGVGDTVSYADGILTWQYSLRASEYLITVNDGDEIVAYGTNSAKISLTKSGTNEIRIVFVDEYGEAFGEARTSVYAYAIVFDARGGTAYLDGVEVDTIYVAKGDTVTLPEADRGNVLADFAGWYTLPDTSDNPDATEYGGDGSLFESGSVFTGNSTLVLYACWLNPRLHITLDAGDGVLLDENGDAVYDTEISLNGRAYNVGVPVRDDASYAFYGWYSGRNGTGIRYTDENGQAYTPFDDESVTILYAFWAEVMTFSETTYNGRTVASVAKGSDTNLFEEITIPSTYTIGGTVLDVAVLSGSAFSSSSNLRVINIPDTVESLNITNNGYDSGTGIFASTPLTDVNIYETGAPSTTKEVTYYSDDGVLYWHNESTGDVQLFYYPYGRTDETYEIPETVSNSTEYEYDDRLNEIPVVRYVNAIGASAFRGHTELTHMEIPEFITSMGTYAFYNCTSLVSVSILGEIDSIGEYSFQGCKALTEVSLPDTLKEIGNRAFRECTSLKSIVIPDSVETVGQYLFYGCTVLESVTLSANITVINSYDFQNCTSLRGIEIPYGVTDINQYAFTGCTALVQADIPYGVTTIGNYAFQNCSSLRGIYLPDSVTSAGTSCFDGCSSATSLHISDGMTSIGSYSFRNCNSLKDVYLPEGLTSIGTYAFQHCYSLTTITIPSTVSTISNYSFQYCYKLVEVYNLSSRSISAGGTSFSTNGGLGNYGFNVYTPTSGESHMVDVDGYLFVYDSSDNYYFVEYDGTETELYFPEYVDGNAYEIYQYALYNENGLTGVYVPDTVTDIGQYAFYGCSGIENLTLGNGVASIGTYAFYGCSSVKSVTLGDAVTSVGDYAFYGCSDLGSAVIGDRVTSVGASAFEGCSSLTSLTLGASVGSVGSNAFAGCYRLVEIYNRSALDVVAGSDDYGAVAHYAKYVYTDGVGHMEDEGDFRFTHDAAGYYLVGYYGSDTDITLPDTVDGNRYAILDYAFYENDTIKSVTIPGTVTYISPYAFYGCTALINVTMGEGITEICDYAFYGCSSLNNLVLPDSVERIGDYAFYGCSGMERITIGERTEYIGDRTFYNCSALMSVSLPDSVEILGTYAFYGCSSLKSVTLGAGITEVGTYTFYNCSSLTNVVILGLLEGIGDYAFSGCSSLRSINIPNSVKSLGTYCFQNCSSLRSVAMGSGVETIGNYCFYGCAAIESIVIPDSVESLGTYVFYNCTALRSVSLGGGIETIGNYCFYQCASLETVAIPDSCTEIGTYCFYQCASLRSVTLGSGIKTIGNYAFYGCPLVKSVTLPDGLETIGNYAFYGCTALSGINAGRNITSIGYNVFVGTAFYNDESNWTDDALYLNVYLVEGNLDTSGDVKVKSGTVLIAERAFYTNTSITGVTLPDSVETICGYAFYNCTSLTDATFGAGLASIGDYAFYGCAKLYDLTIPGGVESIGAYSFYGCSNLTDLVIEDGAGSIGNYAFQNCSSLETVVIPGSVGSIGNGAFYNCQSVTSLTIGDGVKSIGDYAFDSLTGLTSVTLPDSVLTLGKGAFEYCSNVTEFTIGKGLTSAGDYVFRNCSSITYLVFPDSFRTLGSNAFVGCSNLKGVDLGNGIVEIGGSAFSGCAALESIVIPDSCTTMGTYAFSTCTSLTTVTLGSGLTSIGSYCFNGCSKLEGIIIPDSCTSIGERAFYQCTNLSYLVLGDNVESIGSSAFFQCTKIESLVIPESCTSIGTGAFSGCSALYDITIGTAVTSIGQNAFSNTAYYADDDVWEDGVLYIGTYLIVATVSKVSGDYVVKEGTTLLADYSFYGCTSLTGITIPDTVVSIGSYAFKNCSKLTTITIPDSVTYLGTYSFQSCSALETVVIGSGMETISNYSFDSCSKLTAVYYTGTAAQWAAISIGTNNTRFTDAELYYYSETEPATDGNFWHYDENGEIVIWKKD